MRNRQAHPWLDVLRGVRRQVGLGLAGTAAAWVVAGCASPAPPKPPTLNLPEPATAITAQRVGSQVHVRWTTSSNTSDGLPMHGPITAEICREAGPRPETPAARLTACAPVRRITVTPGASEAIDDLPAALQSDPVVLLTYRVQLFNAAGRSAGVSTVAGFTAAGAAPPPVEGLHASNLEVGTVIEWQPTAQPGVVDLERTDLTPPTPHTPAAQPAVAAATPPSKPASKSKKTKNKKAGKSKPAPTASKSKPAADQAVFVHLRAPETSSAQATANTQEGTANGSAGTVDQTAAMGSSYRYVATRVRSVTLGVHHIEIESALSQPVTFARLDTFPPRQPTGLEAIPGSDPEHPAAIDLSWEPNAEPDLAGYRVYRESVDANGAPLGASIELTRALIETPAFRDLTAVAGQPYAYQVLAVDQAGNQSPRSARVLETSTH
jgi:hypothetical protein